MSQSGLFRVVFGAVVRIRLFWPPRDPSLDVFGLLRPIGWTVGLGQGYGARRSVFSFVLLGFVSKSIVFCAKLHYWTLWLFRTLCPGYNKLIGPTLVHGSGHGKGHPKLSWAGFSGCARIKSAWVRTKLAWVGHNMAQVRHKLAWAGPQALQPGF